jgi:hypothetical protein
MFAEVVTVVPVRFIPPLDVSAAVVESAPVAGMLMFPSAVVDVSEAETVTAAP